jgi:hypothetical protein
VRMAAIQAEELLLPGEPTSIRPNPEPSPPRTPAPAAPERHEPLRGEFEPRTVPILQPPSGNLEGYLEEIERTAILRALEVDPLQQDRRRRKAGHQLPGATLPVEEAGTGIALAGACSDRPSYPSPQKSPALPPGFARPTARVVVKPELWRTPRSPPTVLESARSARPRH